MFSRTKSVGRFARSVEIITHRPTIGSFLSSGNYRVLSRSSRKLDILRRQRSVAKHLNLRAGTKVRIVYAHNIESPLARGWQPPHILSSYGGHLSSLMTVYCRLRSLHLQRCTGLNFNETKNISIPTDQVDLAAPPW